MSQTVENSRLGCIHCHNQVGSALFSKNSSGPFCCVGCLTVYELIHLKGLGKFYELQEKFPWQRRSAPLIDLTQDFSHWDTASFRTLYSAQLKNNNLQIKLFLENIHCTACIWLMGKLPEIFTQIKSAYLNFERSELVVEVASDVTLSKLGECIQNLGHRPHPIKVGEGTHEMWLQEKRGMLKKIAVSLMASSNILLLSVSLYGGADKSFAATFAWLSLFLAIPVYFYSARPLFASAWASFKKFRLSLDTLLVVAMSLGGIWSVKLLLTGSTHHYFDSTTSFVTLILITRYLLKYETHKISGSGSEDELFLASLVERLNPQSNKYEKILSSDLKVADQIRLTTGSTVMVDGEILSGNASVSEAVITGEADLVAKKPTDKIFAGSTLHQGVVEAKVAAVQQQTRMGKILQELKVHRPEELLDPTNLRLGEYFVWATLGIGMVVFYFMGFERALSLFLVACPCSYSLATPLALNLARHQLKKKGVFLTRPTDLTLWPKIDTILFDKTGTLTEDVDKCKLRPEAKEVFHELKKNNIKTVILSGDKKENVQAIAKEVAASEFYSELSAQDKDRLMRTYPHAAFVGDGINDTLALNHANFGVALAGPLQVLSQHFSAYTPYKNLQLILNIRKIGIDTVKLIKRNFVLAAVYNFVGLILVLVGVMPPLLAAILMPLNSLTLIFSTVWARWTWK